MVRVAGTGSTADSNSGRRYGPLAAAGFLFVAVLIAGTARGSVVAHAAPPASGPDSEWHRLAIHSIAQGSIVEGFAAPTDAVEPVTVSAEEPGTPDYGPLRLTGLAGSNLNQAMAAAGISEAVAQDYLAALASRIRLADGISVADRFDLIVDREPGATRLLYAGLDRVGASDVQLMRWVVDGKTGWVDATGTAAQAAAMRMPVAARVSSSFGNRLHPILHSLRFHRGIDLSASSGTPIRASADGRVTFAGWDGGYGRQVRIGHGQGLATSYSHMSRIAAAPGQMVRRGQVIGFVGSSGLSTGPHLHYEVFKDGKAVNPMTVRYVGGGDSLDRQERTAFNARLRQLLMAGMTG